MPNEFDFDTPKPSIAARMDAGKNLRKKVSRNAQAEFVLPVNRVDPIDLLIAQGKTRIENLVPVRHARMLTSPFAFLRGGAAIMAQDLRTSLSSGISVQICGDMHVANFGVFASAERNLVFGINDFDETLPGPWEWDLKRLVTSIVVAGRFLGADKVVCEEATRIAVKSYREHMRDFAEMGYLQLWYERIDDRRLLDALPPRVRRMAEENLMERARKRTHLQVLSSQTELFDDKWRIIEDRPLIVRETKDGRGNDIKVALGRFFKAYMETLSEDRRWLLSRYRIVDVARKVVGVGSVGTRCWVVLMEGADRDDPLFLQAKEAQQSVLAPHLLKSASYDNQGHRVVIGQRLIQGAPDILLGWGRTNDVDFYVRQLRDMKGSVEFDPENWDPERLNSYCMACGWALALAHAKSGDAAMIAGYVGKSEALDEALTTFAVAAADQNEKDFALMQAAARQKRIKVAKSF
ncbi:uncharacterized protein (DUF2252 family) [Dongia mobilis]|uniref:Uncharacterized protein (DUF2252 family) n=1 Tax=Dongia mobilis TaxID=578943 RepID=A0A4R6WP60_9PROT|nr:DUF2252 domain-containing protein [Dongia mobilis]TDQ82974.1 uncharacterized protein (DUF2252 family) [Dongia mobilis]